MCALTRAASFGQGRSNVAAHKKNTIATNTPDDGAASGGLVFTRASSHLRGWRAVAVDGVVIAVALGAFLVALTTNNEATAYNDLRLYLL